MKTFIGKLIGLYLNLLAVIAPRKAAIKGFALFCHPFRGKLKDYHHSFFNSAEKFDFMVHDEKIQAYRWGNGAKKVLFLHGWQSHSFRWRNYIEALDKSTHTLFAMDAPAHGLSTGKAMTIPLYCEAILKLIAVSGKPDVVVAHSAGSFTSIYTFHHYPALSPLKMVAMAPPGEAEEMVEFFKSKLGLSHRCLNLILQQFEKAVNQLPSYFSAPYFAASLKFPGLIIHDEKDDETPVENSKNIHRAWKGSRLMLTKGNGHNLKSPDVLKAVLDFIQSEDNMHNKNGAAVISKQTK